MTSSFLSLQRAVQGLGAKRILAVACVATGLLASSHAFSQTAGGTMVMIAQPEPPSLAPYLSTSGPIGLVAPKIYNGLLDYDLDLNPVGDLAESFEVSEDGLTVTFKLREGVKWHDGEPFTSADVEFTIMEVLKNFHPRGPNSFREVSSIDTPDELTAIFNLDKPAPYMMRAFSAYESPIVPKHLLEGKDIREAELGNNPVGTGPFKFVEWKKGQYIRLDKNPDYWKEGLPLLDRVVARIIPDASTRTAAMESGEVHYGAFGAIPNIDVVRLRDSEDIGVTTDGYSMINPMALIELNTQIAPFDDKAVREAVSLVIDRQFLIDNIWFGYGEPATGAMSSNFEPLGLYTPTPEFYPKSPDVDAANALLDEAGLEADDNGVRASVVIDLIPYGEDWRRAGEYLKQAMADIGLELELRYEDVPTWIKRVYGDYDFAMNVNYFYQLPDPVIGVQRHYGTDQIRPGTPFVNSTHFSNAKVDELLEAGAIEPDADKRSEIYAEVSNILGEELPVVNLFEMEFLTVYNEKLKDHTVSAMGAYGSFDRAYIEE